MTPRFFVFEKRIGETPLCALSRLRKEKQIHSGVPLTYAGRLDPMASGKLLVLVGDECKKRGQYDKLDKEYEFGILFGAESDTGDVLGLVSSGAPFLFNEKMFQNVLSSIRGRHVFSYPAFSSKTVNGKPLFEYAREGRLGEIHVPTVNNRIFRTSFVSVRTVSKEALRRMIFDKLGCLKKGENEMIKNDFREGDVSKKWEKFFSESSEKTFPIATCKTIVSSGTYIRTLAPLIGKKLGTSGMVFAINRTKIGRYVPIFERFGFWTRSF